MTDTAVAPIAGDAETATGPPLIVLVLAVVFVVVGAGLLVVDAFGVHVLGYVISSVCTILAVGVYRRLDLSRRLSPGYRPKPAVARFLPVLLIVAFVVAGLHVWAIATELAS